MRTGVTWGQTGCLVFIGNPTKNCDRGYCPTGDAGSVKKDRYTLATGKYLIEND